MPRISFPVDGLIVNYGRCQDVEIKSDPIDGSIEIRIDRKSVMRIESAYHLKITGLTEDGDKIR